MPSDLLPASSYMSFLNDVSYSSNMEAIPTFVAKDMSLVELDKAKTDFLKIYNKEAEEAQKGFERAVTAEDKILSLRKDNDFQAQKLEELKSSLGFDGRLFNLKEEDFNNPYKIKEIESKAARFVSDPNYLSIVRDQQYWDQYQKDIQNVCAGDKANSTLCAMAKQKADQYLADFDGATPGMSLQAADYMPMDITKDIKTDVENLPDHKYLSDPQMSGRSMTMEELTKKSRDLVYTVISNKLKDRRFKNNLVADGFDTDQKQNEYINRLADEYAKENVSKWQFKLMPTASSGAGFTPTTVSPETGYFGHIRSAILPLYNDYMRTKKGSEASKLMSTYGGGDQAFNAAMAWLDKTNPNESGSIAKQMQALSEGTATGGATLDQVKMDGYQKSLVAGNPYVIDIVSSRNEKAQPDLNTIRILRAYDINKPDGGLNPADLIIWKKKVAGIKNNTRIDLSKDPTTLQRLIDGATNKMPFIDADVSLPEPFGNVNNPLTYYYTGQNAVAFGNTGGQQQTQTPQQAQTPTSAQAKPAGTVLFQKNK